MLTTLTVVSFLDYIELCFDRMPPRRKPFVRDLGDGRFLFFDGRGDVIHDATTLSRMFPEYAAACGLLAGQSGLDVAKLITIAALTLPKQTNKQKRYAVYRPLAKLLGFQGYRERERLPPWMVDSIRKSWSDPNEEFTGFQVVDDNLLGRD